MTTTSVLILILIVLAIVLVAIILQRLVRRRSLQKTFGPEYDRVVTEQDSRTAGERELRDRERRHADLTLTPLSAESRARYSAAWEEVQIRFVDSPDEAVGTADALVTRLIAERGYPTGDYDEQLAQLSVEHARTLEHYRDAHQISRRSEAGDAPTEDLRQALVHYRVLFADLLGEDPVRPNTAPTDTAPRDTSRTDTAATDTARSNTSVDGSRPDATTR